MNENIRYVLQEEAAVEDFDDGSLVFLCRNRRLIQINRTARQILELMNGHRELRDIIIQVSEQFSIPEEAARGDVLALVDELGTAGVLRAAVKLGNEERISMNRTSCFLANPGISLREEDGDGAILFNTATDALLIINPIGLVIFKYILVHPRTAQDIVAHLTNACEGVPPDCVEADVEEFLKDLLAKGFIGEALND